MSVWCGLKKGDEVIVLPRFRGGPQSAIVLSAGPKQIRVRVAEHHTVLFSGENGTENDFGPRVVLSKEAYAEACLRDLYVKEIRIVMSPWGRSLVPGRVSTSNLKLAAELLTRKKL